MGFSARREGAKNCDEETYTRAFDSFTIVLMKAVVITGASTGIGKTTALRLSQAGFIVFACVRKEADAKTLQQEMNVKTLLLDVTNEAHIQAAVKEVREVVGEAGLWGLVNNAGIVVAGPLEFLPVSEIRKQFEVNVFAQIAVTQAFMPLLRQASGRVVMMSSIAGRFASPFLAPYAASKFALEGFSDALRRELSGWNVCVSLIEPGRIATPIWEKSVQVAEDMAKQLPPEAQKLYGKKLDLMRERAKTGTNQGVPADEVAKAVEHALVATRPNIRYVVGPDARLATLLIRFLPDRLVDWVARQRAD
jgi:NAD(P)-dependent dehydrogenase (short-subunit alcohol dehydrogenase family)